MSTVSAPTVERRRFCPVEHTAMDVRCPGCGAAWSPADANCEYCGRPIVITTFTSLRGLSASQVRQNLKACTSALDHGADSPELLVSNAICLLRLGLPDRAAKQLDRAIEAELENSEAYFLAAVARLQGRKAFSATLGEVREVERLLQAAIKLEDRGIYFYLIAYLYLDYYARKHLRPPQPLQVPISQAWKHGATQADISLLFELLSVPNPLPTRP